MSIEDAYRDDLAYIHDAGYGGVALDAAQRLRDELHRCGFLEGTVIDLGCGSGILAHRVCEAGYSVVGIDVSDAMVALAKTRAPAAEFHVGSFVSATLPTCVAAAAIGEVLNYGFDTENGESVRGELFRRVHRALVPGGLWLFDMAGPGRVPPGGPHRAFAEGPDWAVLIEITFEPTTGVLTRHIASLRQVGDLCRRDVEVHRLTLVDRADVLASLRTAGFEAQTISSYGGSGLPPGVLAFLARRPVDAI